MKRHQSMISRISGFILFLSISVPAQDPLVTILAPNGGERFYVGDTILVRWNTDTTIVPQVLVQISVDSGKIFKDMTPRSILAGSAQWSNVRYMISDTLKGKIPTPSKACLVRVFSYFDPGTKDLSDGFFTIAMPIDLVSPERGDTFVAGDFMHILWTADSQRVPAVKVLLSSDSGRTYPIILADSITARSPQWGDYSWTIPDSLGVDSLKFMIKITSATKAMIHDQSPGYFTIKPALVSDPGEEKPGCGCGSGTALAFIPPIGFKVRKLIKKKA